jgi:hypothetical protein
MSFTQAFRGVAACKCSSDVTQIKDLLKPLSQNDESVLKLDERRKSLVIHGDFNDELYI